MSATRPTPARAGLDPDAKLFLAVYGGVWALTLATAGLCAACTPLHVLVRDHIGAGLQLYPHAHPSLPAALVTFLHNARAAGWPLLFALLNLERERWQRQLGVVLLGAFVLVNTALVGAAIAAGGPQIVPFLIHLPLEWAALTLAATGWLLSAAGNLDRRSLRVLIAWFVALLTVAAVIETYAVPHLSG